MTDENKIHSSARICPFCKKAVSKIFAHDCKAEIEFIPEMLSNQGVKGTGMDVFPKKRGRPRKICPPS